MGEIRIDGPSKTRGYPYPVCKKLFSPTFTYISSQLIQNISIFHGCMVWIEKSVTTVTDWHHKASQGLSSVAEQ